MTTPPSSHKGPLRFAEDALADRTDIGSARADDAGPTNNWADPLEIRERRG
jgi:GTP-dependent phosphoenolpyruvate carboxykinase